MFSCFSDRPVTFEKHRLLKNNFSKVGASHGASCRGYGVFSSISILANLSYVVLEVGASFDSDAVLKVVVTATFPWRREFSAWFGPHALAKNICASSHAIAGCGTSATNPNVMSMISGFVSRARVLGLDERLNGQMASQLTFVFFFQLSHTLSRRTVILV